jgi:hypothetical protein
MADSLEEGDYRKEGYYGTFQSGLPQPVPPSQGPHYSGQYPSVTGLFLLLLLAGSCCVHFCAHGLVLNVFANPRNVHCSMLLTQ